jgi:hypothetical protein
LTQLVPSKGSIASHASIAVVLAVSHNPVQMLCSGSQPLLANLHGLDMRPIAKSVHTPWLHASVHAPLMLSNTLHPAVTSLVIESGMSSLTKSAVSQAYSHVFEPIVLGENFFVSFAPNIQADL